LIQNEFEKTIVHENFQLKRLSLSFHILKSNANEIKLYYFNRNAVVCLCYGR